MSVELDEAIERLSERHAKVLALALKAAQDRLQADPSEQNIRAAAAAKRALEEALPPRPASDPPRLKHRLEILGWLKEQGYKIGKSKLYADAAAGRIRLEADGGCTAEEAERYARRVGLKRLAAVDSAEVEREAKRKLENEVALLEAKRRKIEFELELASGRYLPRTEHEQELAARAVALKQGLIHLAQSRTAEVVAAAADRGIEEAAALLQTLIEDLLDDYARREEIEIPAPAAAKEAP